MDIRDALARKQTLSFEIFPPKGDLSVEQADTIAHALAQSDPDWISVTFSAGGSGNAQSSRAIAALVERECAPTQALAHLTCMGLAAADADASVDALLAEGVHNVLALRGDRVPGCGTRDFPHASDLVAHIKHRTPEVCVGGACYPEGHVECESLDADIEALKRKQDAGVDFLVTQLFFMNEDFYRFRERCVRARIKVPIVCGIMPFTSVRQIQRMAFSCGASIPAKVVKCLVRAGEDPAAQRAAGVEYACEQLCDLAANGVDGLHVYSMNRPEVGSAAHEALLACGYLGV